MSSREFRVGPTFPGYGRDTEGMLCAPGSIKFLQEIFLEKGLAVNVVWVSKQGLPGVDFVIPSIQDAEGNFVGQQGYKMGIHSPAVAMRIFAAQAE